MHQYYRDQQQLWFATVFEAVSFVGSAGLFDVTVRGNRS